MTSAPALDPRVHVFRPDLADASLRVFVKADRYVEPVMARCLAGVIPMFASPEPSAHRVSEIRYGEFLDIFERGEGGYAWVQNKADSYVGYIHNLHALSESLADNAYRINVLSSFLYAEPEFRSTVIDRLTLGSYLHVLGEVNGFYQLAGGGFVFAPHVVSSEDASSLTFVQTAGRLLGVPYLWGGRTALGLDCSGLVQLALDLAGYECPRDVDQQAELFGKPLPKHWRDMAWRRGDLVFFPDHVGIMAGEDHLIHANKFSMSVVSEPLVDVVARDKDIVSFGRF